MYDVIIAGAGPVGLFLACELSLQGVSVVIVEKQAHPQSPHKSLPLGMRGLNVPTLEAFQRRGLLEGITKHSPTNVHTPGARAGHFAGLSFFQGDIDTTKWKFRLPGSPAKHNLAVELAHLEAVLTERAVEQGVEIRRNQAVQDYRTADDTVEIRTCDKTFHAKWLVGCDGAHSVVRKLGGFEFLGTEPEFTAYSALVELADGVDLQPGRQDTPSGIYLWSPATGHLILAEFDGGAGHGTCITVEYLQAVLRRITPNTNATIVTAQHIATWTDRTAQVATYCKGRVLLAGDAAHIHSPLGGQGINLGIGDAVNLGWKLAATIHGWAPDGLLDTYGTERHPVGEQVLDWSRAQVLVMNNASQASRAMRKILSDILATRDGATHFAEMVMGVSLRYNLDFGGHDLAGRSCPNFEFTTTPRTRIGDLLREGSGILLAFDSNKDLQTIWSRWTGRIRYITGEVKENFGLSTVLVRPDGIVAWACEGEPDIEELERVMLRWFGHQG